MPPLNNSPDSPLFAPHSLPTCEGQPLHVVCQNLNFDLPVQEDVVG